MNPEKTEMATRSSVDGLKMSITESAIMSIRGQFWQLFRVRSLAQMHGKMHEAKTSLWWRTKKFRTGVKGRTDAVSRAWFSQNHGWWWSRAKRLWSVPKEKSESLIFAGTNKAQWCRIKSQPDQKTRRGASGAGNGIWLPAQNAYSKIEQENLKTAMANKK